MNDKVLLVILDGWGLSPAFAGNAIRLANAENFNYLWRSYPHYALSTSPKTPSLNYFIDSNLGAAILSGGRFLPQNIDYIDNKISDGSFFENEALNDAINKCITYQSSIHLIGSISESFERSSLNHLFALLDLAKDKGVVQVYLHLICESETSGGTSAEASINKIKEYINKIGLGKIATIAGENYCYEGKASLNNIVKFYETIMASDGNKSLDVSQTLNQNKKENRSSADIFPTIIYENNYPVVRVKDFDSLIFYNFDDKSLRTISGMFLGRRHAAKRKEVYNVYVTVFADYFDLVDNDQIKIAFARNDFRPNLANTLSKHGKQQTFISNIKKSGSAIFAFCGQKQLLPGQTNQIINIESSLRASTDQIFNEIIRTVTVGRQNFICANFSWADVEAHLGNIVDVEKAVKHIDSKLLNIEQAALSAGYELIITADHGFVEQLAQRHDGVSVCRHSRNPVPFIHISRGGQKKTYELGIKDNLLSEILNSKHSICDVAPTVLDLFGLNKLDTMTGKSLFGRENI